MKKTFLILLLFFPICVYASGPITITYDANDGSGRTKVVTYEDSSNVKMLGNDVFNQLDDDPDTYEDDKIIDRWHKKEDCSDWGYSVFSTYDDIIGDDENMEFLTLYAGWEGRKDITEFWDDTIAFGDAVSGYNDKNYSIEKEKDFEIEFDFHENDTGDQFAQLNKYKLPDYFVNSFTKDVEKALSNKFTITITCVTSRGTFEYKGKFYIKDGYMYIDFIEEDTEESNAFWACANVWIRVKYKFKWTKEYKNNRWMYVVSIKDTVTVYPQGKITVKYVDIDTNEEISDEVLTEDVLGEKYTPVSKNIDDYKLIESPTEVSYEYDEEEQVLYYKYRKSSLIKNDKVENPVTSDSFVKCLAALIVVSLVIFNLKKLIRKKYSF